MKANGNCRACKKPVRWMVNARSGNRNPLDPDPVSNGNVRVEGGKCYVLSPERANELHGAGVPLYVIHFAYCPAKEA